MRRTPPMPITLQLDDGSMLAFVPEEPRESDAVHITVVRDVPRRRFRTCPICLDAPATHKEHVPPYALGGANMLLTCEPCNNRLGSYLEADLADWFDGSFQMRFSSDVMPGSRKVRRARYMLTNDGGFVLLVDDAQPRQDSALAAALASGELLVEAGPPNQNRSRLGLLKSMYLAACLDMGGPPAGEVAAKVRDDLVTARDAATAATVPRSELALGLQVAQAHDGQRALDAPVMIGVSGTEPELRWGALLAGRTFVEFPPGFPVAGINEPARPLPPCPSS